MDEILNVGYERITSYCLKMKQTNVYGTERCVEGN
jgi:hypothetical protein